MQILAISGSLREGSSNTEVLRAVALLVPPDTTVILFNRLADIPPFNPDHDNEAPPPAIAGLRALLNQSAAVVISSPEYAHGVSGVLKNALDWLVSGVELSGKPVALINAAPRATHAHAALAETLRTMDARVIEEASVGVPLTGRNLDAAGIAADKDLSRTLQTAITALLQAT